VEPLDHRCKLPERQARRAVGVLACRSPVEARPIDAVEVERAPGAVDEERTTGLEHGVDGTRKRGGKARLLWGFRELGHDDDHEHHHDHEHREAAATVLQRS
jgi:hypothetical protein